MVPRVSGLERSHCIHTTGRFQLHIYHHIASLNYLHCNGEVIKLLRKFSNLLLYLSGKKLILVLYM